MILKQICSLKSKSFIFMNFQWEYIEQEYPTFLLEKYNIEFLL